MTPSTATPRPRSGPLVDRQALRVLVAAVMAGREPAETLPPMQRRAVMAAWVRAGWPDREIAVHTRWSEYTVARIRSGLGLAANP